jgi:hypothetical protein
VIDPESGSLLVMDYEVNKSYLLSEFVTTRKASKMYRDGITRTVFYPISEYRLMQEVNGVNTFDNELARGSIDEVIAAREKFYKNNGEGNHGLYIQAHYPNGHPDFPGYGGVWVKYDLFRG